MLDAAKSTPDGAVRAKYNYAKVLGIVSAKVRGRTARPIKKRTTPAPAQEAPARSLPAAVSAIDLDALSRSVTAAVTDALKPVVAAALGAAQKQVLDGLATLDATRKSLMLRYDSELHALRTRVGELSQENQKLKSQTTELDGARISTELTRVRGRLDNIDTKLKGP